MSQKYDILFFFCDILFFRRQIKKGEIKANNVVNIDSVNDLNIKNSDISTSANDSKIVLISQKGDVNIKNDYSKSSSFEQINTDSQNPILQRV